MSIRKFVKPRDEWVEVSTVNTETGEVKFWLESDGISFGEWVNSIFEFGSKSANEFIKKRRNKERGWKEITVSVGNV